MLFSDNAIGEVNEPCNVINNEGKEGQEGQENNENALGQEGQEGQENALPEEKQICIQNEGEIIKNASEENTTPEKGFIDNKIDSNNDDTKKETNITGNSEESGLILENKIIKLDDEDSKKNETNTEITISSSNINDTITIQETNQNNESKNNNQRENIQENVPV